MNDLYLNPYYDLEEESDFERWINEHDANTCPYCGQVFEAVSMQQQSEMAPF